MFPFDEGEHCLRQMWLQTTWQSGLRIVLDKDLHDAELFKYKKERLYLSVHMELIKGKIEICTIAVLLTSL